MKKRSLFLVAGISILLTTFFGCNNSVGTDGVNTFTVSGFARFDNADDHSGIVITLESTDGLSGAKFATSRSISPNANYSKQTVTDSNGKYEFTEVPEGTYTVYATFGDSVEKAAVLTNRSITGDTELESLGLTAVGSISGQITINGSTNEVYGYEVLVLGTSYSASIDKNGNFTITGVPAKSEAYDLCFVGDSYRYIAWEKVTVSPSSTTSLEKKNISFTSWNENKFEWLGEKDAAPANAKKNQAYYNKTDGCSYIFNGTTWELLASAGKNGTNGTNGVNGADGKDGVDGKDGANGKDADAEAYVSVTATDKGIKFTSSILSNVIADTNNYFDTVAKVKFEIKDVNNDITLVRNWTKPTNEWITCDTYYPFVEAGKEYTFTFTARNEDYVLYTKDFTIEATGGLGEYKITNADEYDIELTEKKVIRNTTKSEFTDNPNVNVLSVKKAFDIYKGDYEAWLYATTVEGEDASIDLENMDDGWRPFEYIDNALKGNQYSIHSITQITVAGYQDNGQTYFEMNDYKSKIGDWGGEEVKVYVISGSCPDGYNMADIYTNLLDGMEELFTVTVTGTDGTKNSSTVKYRYSIVDYKGILFEPTIAPTYKNLPLSEFTGWMYYYPSSVNDIYYPTFPIEVTPKKISGNVELKNANGEVIEYAVVSAPRITPYAYVTIMDGNDKLIDNKKIDISIVYSEVSKDGFTLDGLYTDEACTKLFSEYYYELLYGKENPTESIILYSKWTAKDNSIE